MGGFIGSLATNQFQAVVSQIGKVAGNRKAEQQPPAKAGKSAVNAAEAVLCGFVTAQVGTRLLDRLRSAGRAPALKP